MTFLVLHTAETRQKLEIAISQAASVAQTYNCLLTRLDFQQEDGLMSSLPLGLNRIKIERSLTTSALAVFVPFVTQEVFMGGDAMYYGLNALSNNMILLDRKQSRCPNGLVFGTPGSGKSMSCKREITFIMLMTQDKRAIIRLSGDSQFERDFYCEYTNENCTFTLINGALIIKGKDIWGTPIEIDIS